MNSIDSINKTYERQAVITDATRQNKDAVEKQPSDPQDAGSEVKVSLSSESKDLQLAKETALSAPDDQASADRSERVAALKKEVEEGKYQADPGQAADKIVGGVIDEIV